MSHEIYYTSAPEGMKRGTSGFCTVAASENIPKALWDRLETLSAYRHQFGAGDQPNPVSFAHWILNVTGKTHHVLSRICDSGVDHTQRTNAFAHHLVLERSEIEAAPGGPAWMLQQAGVMARQWDGRVGALPPARVPTGDDYAPSRICKAWAAATGDAGWGGHLADLFAKAPTRPVCLLFAPGQNVLPLIAEALALLPPAARWNVTFNTYFTSMPTSATCLWRCCLAGTPAATIGRQYAASGLLLDLTDRTRLPALPAGPYVTMARTGEAAEAPRLAAKGPAQPTLAELKSRAAATGAKPQVPKPVYDPEGDEEEREAQRRRDRVFESGPPPESDLKDMPAEDSTYELKGEDAPAASVPVGWRGPAAGWPIPGRMMRRADEALEEAEREARQAAGQRRKQVLLLFAGALGALAVGSALVYWSIATSAPPALPATNSVYHPKPPETAPLVVVVPDTTPATAIVQTAPALTTTTQIAETKPLATQTVVVPTITYPDSLVLSAALERPDIGTGIGDRVQSLGLRAADLDPLPVSALRMIFFAGQGDKPPATGTPAPANTPAVYKNTTLGTLSALPGTRNNKPGVALYWKPASDPGMGVDLLFIDFDRAKPGIELQWHAAELLRNPVYNYIYWTLQNSALTLESPRNVRQQITMKPFVPPVVNLAEASVTLPWPAALPKDVRVVEPPPETLPRGWKADWYLDWDTKDPAARTTENASQVISFKKSTNNPKVDAWFLLTFKPGSGGGVAKVESTFAKRFQQDQDDLARAEKDLADITTKINDLLNNPALKTFGGGVPAEDTAKQAAAQAAVDAYKAAVAGYNELDAFDVSFNLADNMRLATLRFQRPKAPETGK